MVLLKENLYGNDIVCIHGTVSCVFLWEVLMTEYSDKPLFVSFYDSKETREKVCRWLYSMFSYLNEDRS